MAGGATGGVAGSAMGGVAGSAMGGVAGSGAGGEAGAAGEGGANGGADDGRGGTPGGGLGGGAGTGGTPSSDCIRVSPTGDDALGAASGGTVPFLTIQTAIDYADHHRNGPHDVCVAAGAVCNVPSMFYGPVDTDFTMRDGISVFGDYESTGWTRCGRFASASLWLRTARGVVFGPDIVSPTRFEGFWLTWSPSDVVATGVTLDRAHSAVVEHVAMGNPPTAATTIIGVDAVDSEARLDDFAMRSQCLNLGSSPCPPRQIGIRGTGSALTITNTDINIRPSSLLGQELPTESAVGVTLDDATGSSLIDSSIHVQGALVVLGLHVGATSNLVLDGTGVVVGALSGNGPSPVTAVELVDDDGVSWSDARLEINAGKFEDGVVIENSPGVHIDGSLRGIFTMFSGALVRISGDATGTTIAGSMEVANSWADAGVIIDGCAGASPRLLASLTLAYAAANDGIRVSGDCAPTITSAVQVTLNQAPVLAGVHCLGASRCTVDGSEIRVVGVSSGGTSSCSSGPICPTLTSYGVLCEPGSCVTIRDSQVHGLSLSGTPQAHYFGGGVSAPGATLVSGNVIDAGCTGGDGVGLRAAGRIENNVIQGPRCGSSFTFTPRAKGLELTGDASVHSNTISGGGATDGGPYTGACESVGVALTSGSVALRDNILLASTCATRIPFRRAAAAPSPTVFGHNDLFPGAGFASLYLDGSTLLSTIDAVNALPGATANLAADPLLDSTAHLTSSSPCIDTGTTTSAPSEDIDGDLRDRTPDIGADEWVPAASNGGAVVPVPGR